MKTNRPKPKIKEYVAIGMILAWLILIFLLSNQVADNSSSMSGGFSDFFLRILHKLVQGADLDVDLFHYFTRKTAHFMLYLILGVLLYHGFYQNKHMVSYQRLAMAWTICIAYAISDEVHQYFVPGRSMELGDVLIDSFGALMGLILVRWLLNKRRGNK